MTSVKNSVHVFVCVSVRVFVWAAGPAPASFLLVGKGNSRLQPCWLPTDLTLTPEVNTLVLVCVCVLRIYHSICDWLVVTVTYVMGPLCRSHPVWLSVRVCVCVYKHVWVNLIYFQYITFFFLPFLCISGFVWVCECTCVLSCQQGFQTPVAPHWGILTLSLLDFLHPNIAPPDSPICHSSAPFCAASSSMCVCTSVYFVFVFLWLPSCVFLS